uniref:C-type lectin domain-containing protein n=1 Tax=Plectus sambesii TaxID=2011161 RepID=A0A914WEW4_9BILA
MYGEYSDWWVSPCTADYYGGGICKAPCGTDQCASNPCQNGATCEASPYDASSYQCKLNCPSNCYGQQCEVCVPTSSVCVAGCPPGFTQSVPGSCFSVLTGNFQTADASCTSSGGRIATINDAAEDYQIRSWLTAIGQSHAMIGYGDPSSVGTFQWADGSASTYVRCSGLSTGYCCLIPSIASSASGDWELGSCATDYGAAVCRTPCFDPCTPDPCQNGATCEPASYDTTTFQCKLNCPSNCYGKQCDVCVAAASVCETCPAGFTQVVPGSCYSALSGDFQTTDTDCGNNGGRIATINDAAEDYQIRSE